MANDICLTMEQDKIEQKGRVIDIDTNKVKVNILVQEACAHCAMSGFCPGAKTRTIEADKPDFQVEKGQPVSVVMDEKVGFNALLYVYIIPFFILMAVLIITEILTHNDGLSGLAAVISVIPYYIILYFMKKRFEKKIHFKIKPL